MEGNPVSEIFDQVDLIERLIIVNMRLFRWEEKAREARERGDKEALAECMEAIMDLNEERRRVKAELRKKLGLRSEEHRIYGEKKGV
jgi:antitoxin component HigA of HigAB toxin-antitoxin module